MSEKIIRLFTAEHCTPCHEIKKLVEEGRFTIDGKSEGEAEIIDLETDEGFENVEKHSLDAIPSAIDESGKKCKISVDEENQVVQFKCSE